MSMVVKMEATIIFMRLAGRTAGAERRIAQLDENQNAAAGGKDLSTSEVGSLALAKFSAKSQRNPDQSSATSIESLGFEGSYFTLAGWPATSRSKRICPSRPVMSCAV